MTRTLSSALLMPELVFTTSRSSGPGGQNVNKVNSKVTLKFDVAASSILTEDEKTILLEKLNRYLTTRGVLVLSSQDSRSQVDNKEDVVNKFNTLVVKAFLKKKIRKATKPSKTAVQKRLKDKKQRSEKKKWRSGME